MPFTYEFTQYALPGPGQAGGVKAVWRYTSDLVPYTDGSGNAFTPTIISHDALNLSQENNSGQVYVNCARDLPVAQLYYRGVPAGAIWLRVRDQDTGMVGYVGRIRSCEWAEATARLLMTSSSDMLSRDGLRLHWQGPCGWSLYGPRCGINRDAQDGSGNFLYRTDGTVEAVSADGLTLTSATFATRPDGFFNAGSFIAGDYHRMVLSHTGSSIVLLTAIDGLAPGAVFSAAKGCNRSTGAGGCADFQNITFFGGTPNVPLKNIFASGVADGV
ncbi:phage BR0599 family protein [Burkholderia cepacia]|uniref:phage BR0599 family protein n=1 Tax=Burkholderia cepacia TaxID=292 RepID=UPI0007574C26|nr:phage BR0599 family protein [Burkholderia cepacia]KWF99098.1 hypothetical protein WL95_00340 [Burkholderia cepacia]